MASAAPFGLATPRDAAQHRRRPRRLHPHHLVLSMLGGQHDLGWPRGGVLATMAAQFAAEPGEQPRGRTGGRVPAGLGSNGKSERTDSQGRDLWGAWKWQCAGARITKAQPYSRGRLNETAIPQTSDAPNDLISISQAAGLHHPSQVRPFRPAETKAEREGRGCNAHDGHASDDEGGRRERAPGGNLSEAVKQAENQSWRERSQAIFVKKFYAPGTLAAKNTKRKRVEEIMEALETEFPLGIKDVVGIASVLDSAGLKAGDQYLAEAKAMHVEAGHNWSAPLEANMTLCRRALRRDKGPECRAKEVKIQDISEDVWELYTLAARNPQRVAWSYAWATIWMLRAVEAAEVRIGHVMFGDGGKKVCLRIPKSKTDQEASGTTRSLGCCGLEACSRQCPVALAVRALAEHPNAHPEDPLFPDQEGNPVSKLQLVTAWTRHLDKDMSGHSARRSGAMMYTRMGLDIQTVGFLGRWKSSAVFRYVEEAMKEMPLNRQVKVGTWAKTSISPTSEAGIPEGTNTGPAEKVDEPMGEKDGHEPRNGEDEAPLWAVSRTRDRSIIHKVKEASWNIQLNEWKTMCGWHFAKHNVKVELTRRPPEKAIICVKCNRLGEMRDEVRKAREWAHLLQL